MKKIDTKKVAYKQFDDPHKIEYLNSSLRRYFFVDYYDSNNSADKMDDTVFKKISSQYSSLDDYTREKLLVNKMISDGVPIPEDIDRRLTITKQELESANMFTIFGRV